MTYIENWLQALFQRFVDITQRKPIWWAKWAAELLLVTAVGNAWIDPTASGPVKYLLIFCALLVGTFMVVITRAQTGWDIFRKLTHDPLFVGLRKAMLVISVVSAFAWADGLDLLVDALHLSIYYLAMCDDPKPKQPRTRAVPQT